ncbi:MAG: hypothetical protein RLY67_1077 [Pseudomonadota bacterium]
MAQLDMPTSERRVLAQEDALMMSPVESDEESFDYSEAQQFSVSSEHDGLRLDRFLSLMIPNLSRARLQAWIEAGTVCVNEEVCEKSSRSITSNDRVVVQPIEPPVSAEWIPEDIPLDLVFEDAHILVVNKPAGLVVHPAAGHPRGTLLNGLLHHYPDAARLPRAGIVHRLDKDTSGLMVVAKTLSSQTELVRQISGREVRRVYRTLAWGIPTKSQTISEWIGRDPRDRQKMARLATGQGKAAVTHVETIRFGTLIDREVAECECRLETGRTHQIRVHLEYVGCPIVGDPLYSKRAPIKGPVIGFHRQALHATALGLAHPHSGEALMFNAPPPKDHADLLERVSWNA